MHHDDELIPLKEAPTPGARRARLHRWNRFHGYRRLRVYTGTDLTAALIEHGYIDADDADDADKLAKAVYEAACARFGI